VSLHPLSEIREGRPRVVDGYLAALRAGSTLPPLELAQMADVDLGSREPYERFAAFFGHLVDELVTSWG
jgi:oligoendopeptidase F